jgi:hypothetical protein
MKHVLVYEAFEGPSPIDDYIMRMVKNDFLGALGDYATYDSGTGTILIDELGQVNDRYIPIEITITLGWKSRIWNDHAHLIRLGLIPTRTQVFPIRLDFKAVYPINGETSSETLELGYTTYQSTRIAQVINRLVDRVSTEVSISDASYRMDQNK